MKPPSLILLQRKIGESRNNNEADRAGKRPPVAWVGGGDWAQLELTDALGLCLPYL